MLGFAPPTTLTPTPAKPLAQRAPHTEERLPVEDGRVSGVNGRAEHDAGDAHYGPNVEEFRDSMLEEDNRVEHADPCDSRTRKRQGSLPQGQHDGDLDQHNRQRGVDWEWNLVCRNFCGLGRAGSDWCASRPRLMSCSP
jgi:hypothetical protein